MNPSPDSPLVDMAHALEGFPGYLVNFTVALLVAMLTDPVVTALTMGAAVLGVITTPLIAVASFALAYVVLRTVNNIAQAIGMSGNRLANALALKGVPDP